jgi:hypothetical protein
VLAVHGAAVIHGALHVRNHYTPKASDKWTSVTATSRPVLGLSCTTTTGRGTTGKRARHWVASVSGKAVILKSAAGRHATC